ncbi:Phosphoinositide-binding clathrin adaptor [Heracleum sosnowskyi]|uniref:Phosphoinositide-binding clathrin adaptor n=1 Tax=Heracleum sosnowskyi TaxID=360622 RepID=A0AAD8MU62_9APIA|nr:Phosphoinositide-binding clathrin adaptor [Heracleum sosnowskyi]
MNLWKTATGVLKDQSSVWLTSFSKRTPWRNPDIEVAVIKSTTHNDSRVDYRNAQRVFAWVRVSPAYLKPLVLAIALRIQKTRSWVVALKGLMLMHGVFCSRVPAVQRIGRLPFDLSSFKDQHSKHGEKWAHDTFIRAYYSFLDRKSSLLYSHAQEQYKGHLRKVEADQDEQKTTTTMIQCLVWLQEMQDLLDMLMEIKPRSESMVGTLILEAMDCVMIEIFDVYSRICSGISALLIQICSAGKVEASMGLKVFHKANTQGKELCLYIEFCRELGVNNAVNCPTVKQIPEEDIRMLEHIITAVPHTSNEQNNDTTKERSSSVVPNDSGRHSLQTKVTDQWEAFDEDRSRIFVMAEKVAKSREEHFKALLPLIDIHAHGNKTEFPNLISL